MFDRRESIILTSCMLRANRLDNLQFFFYRSDVVVHIFTKTSNVIWLVDGGKAINLNELLLPIV